MKKLKKQTIKIICLVIAIISILMLPINSYIDSYYTVYASSTVVDNELLKQTFIPLLISAGLVFKSNESIDDVWQKLNDYWVQNDIYLKYWQKGPEDPKPDLKTVLFASITGSLFWDALKRDFKWVGNVSSELWEDIKNWVDEKYNPGENVTYNIPGLTFINLNTIIDYSLTQNRHYITNGNDGDFIIMYYKFKSIETIYNHINSDKLVSNRNICFISCGKSGSLYNFDKRINYNSVSFMTPYNVNISDIDFIAYETNTTNIPSITSNNLQKIITIGQENIVDNSNYDWNNQYTNDKSIVLPIQSDINGKPKVDTEGMYIPTIDTEHWIDVQPEEIPEMDPSGVPQPKEEELPIIPDNPEDNEGKILVYLKSIFETITGIRNDTSTIAENTSPATEGGGNGTYDPTDIDTGFDWGNFRKFFDIIYIFIYFIIILILILVKFLGVVFTQLTAIPANSALFDSYPSILSGVNYIKNLKVGNLSITVHQAFEYIFMIFFFIFIIKQIRKLYGAYVYEETERERDNAKQMRLDYYDKQKNYSNSNNESFNNIKITDYTKK